MKHRTCLGARNGISVVDAKVGSVYRKYAIRIARKVQDVLGTPDGIAGRGQPSW